MKLFNRIRALAAALALTLSLGACASPLPSPTVDPADGTLTVRFLDVGQADAALLRCGEDAMLIDGGNVADSSLIAAVLEDEGLDVLDVVVATHAHEDHVGGLSGALNVCSVGRVLAPVAEYDSKAFSNFVKYTEAQGLAVEIPAAGDTFSLGDAGVTVLGPVKAYDDTNNTSIVLRVDYGNTSFLFTGDMERDAEADLLEFWGEDALRADVLKVGHHGSETSTSYPFLRAAAPQIAVISVGEGNSYGHPDDAVLSRLSDAGAQVFRTDECGDVAVVSDGQTLSVRTQSSPESPFSTSAAPPTSASQAAYIGNVNSKKFHLESCPSLPAEQNRVWFSTREAAVEAGYFPCGTCKP